VSAVLLVYGLAAYALLWGVDGLARLLALPPIFGLIVRVLFVLMAPVVGAVAWRYPRLGEDARASRDGDRRIRDDSLREE
jgi:hypothetical protein